MKTYLRLLRFSRPYLDFVPQYVVFTVLGILFGLFNFTLLIPMLNVLFGTTGEQVQAAPASLPAFELSTEYASDVFNYYFAQVIAERGRLGALTFVCGVLVASVFLANFFKYLAFRVVARIRARVIRNVRHGLYERVTQLHLGYFTQGRKGDLMSRLTNDVQEVESSVISTLTVVVREPLQIIAYFVMLFTLSTKLTLFTLLFLPVSGLIISTLSKRLKRSAQQGQHTLGSMLGIFDETLGGMRVIKAFNAEAHMMSKFREQNGTYYRVVRAMGNARDLASPLSEVLGVLVVVVLLYVGGSMVLTGESALSASKFITYIVFFSQVLVPAKALSSGFSYIQRGLVAGRRILDVIDTESAVRDQPGAHELPPFQQQVEFRGVAFSYGEHAVLQDINLTVTKGQTVALVGPSGGGKSTLADLVPRFYDPTAGQILIDGHDLRACTLHSVREQMGIVTQESILFNDTIFNNIRFNKADATEDEVVEAAKIANAHEFIMASPEGYHTVIGDRGARLSGGQRQRLSIARAILRNPPILILDEATSALDTESEKLVQQALTRLMANRTSIVIAHRLSTVQHADEIVVIQHGRIVERGTHQQLLTRPDGLYARLSKLQNNPALA
ncbi:ABC transporter ATP-binding protein [Hymenobacter sp. B81]|uniref:ABC transporter ATP-binding protein n=1 Tax=Hymenobacter sp. B81 TaxID=3344878 RepID=UPI0037DDA772